MNPPGTNLHSGDPGYGAVQLSRAPGYAWAGPPVGSTYDPHLTRHAWRTRYASRLPGDVRVQTCAYFFDPCVPDTPGLGPWAKAQQVQPGPQGLRPAHDVPHHRGSRARDTVDRDYSNPPGAAHRAVVARRANPHSNGQRALAYDIDVNPLTADWILSGLAHQLRGRRSARSVLNSTISALQCVLRRPGGPRVLVGVRLMASGRLGRQKKGLAQRLTRTIGRLPASSLRAKVELCQDFVNGPLGSVGLKVWVCYA